MLFSSAEFIFFFLPVTWLIFYVLGRRHWHQACVVWLAAASLFFYGWWNPKYLLLLGGSVGMNYFLGTHLIRTRQQGPGGLRRTILIGGLIFNVALLVYFKYSNFFVLNVNHLLHLNWRWADVILPLGISFFTFQKIAYLVDAYKGDIETTDFWEYLLFVSFFPQLIAGPIVHHKEIMPQFRRGVFTPPDSRQIALGLVVFIIGLSHKILLADNLAPIVDLAFNQKKLWMFEAWVAMLAYTFQLYFDFAGYSYMALGLGAMFGVRLPLNFHSPYQATSIIDFWRRWHMTLSRFLRDYLYIPLGGNRLGKTRRYVNLFLVMLIGGLWHGAGWTFVAWGALHGLYLCINHAWHAHCKRRGGFNWFETAIGQRAGWLLTFLAVIAGWVFFRAPDFASAWMILKSLVGLNGLSVPVSWAPWVESFTWLVKPRGLLIKVTTQAVNLICLAIAMGIALRGPHLLRILHRYQASICFDPPEPDAPAPTHPVFDFNWKWLLVISALGALALMSLAQESPFLYFQF